jgi:predicted helicase
MNALQTGGIENIKSFDQLFPFLRNELDWPIEEDDFEIDELTFEYDPAKDLGLKEEDIAHIREIRQLRPLETDQPWGIFFVNFDDKKIPVGVLKRILGGLTLKKRQSANKAEQKGWDLHDLLFISASGDSGDRELSFLHFSEENGGKNKVVLKELGWDRHDTKTKQTYVYHTLKEHLSWPDDADGFAEWTQAFTIGHGETIKTSKMLTKRLAELASAIRKSAGEILKAENKDGPFTKIFEDFKKTIFHNLTPADFADMYAQTICYGLLVQQIIRAEKGEDTKTLSADDAAITENVMQPFLKDMMETFLAVGGRKSKMDFNELGVNEVVELLQSANMQAVVLDFDNKNPNEDPILHFYEHFLKDYDSIMREQRGVYYTPLPVVRFIVRSVDEILTKEFGLEDGLADTTTWGEMLAKNPEMTLPEHASEDMPFVQILDPATGTGTFLVETINQIEKKLKSKWQKAGNSEKEIDALWNDYVPQHLLPRLNGFELMMAPYAIAHIKIGMKLAETGCQPKEDEQERVRVYLTNTLEEPTDQGKGHTISFQFIADSLALEAKGADDIKAKTPITVVIGNPPYAKHNENRNPTVKNRKSTFIGNIINDYYAINGQPLNEKNSKNIKQDENKFIRYAEHRIDSANIGVLGYISASGYLDGVTMRGMRWHLMQSFDKIQLIDLHGNIKRDAKDDQNVFPLITQGVAISLMSKTSDQNSEVSLYDFSGRRDEKYKWLLTNGISSIKTKPLSPRADKFFFVERAYEGLEEFEEEFVICNSIFQEYNTGMKTHRDHFAVAFDEEKIRSRVADLRDANLSDDDIRNRYQLTDNRDWKLKSARTTIQNDLSWQNKIKVCLYRPFDRMSCYYNSVAMDWPREDIMQHMLAGHNIALITTCQQSKQNETWALAGVTNNIIECCTISNRTREINYLLPLFLYHQNHGQTEITPNLDKNFANSIATHTNLIYDSGIKVKQQALPLPELQPEAPKQASMSLPDPNMGRGNLDKTFGPRDVFDYIYAVLHSPAYRSRYADFLKSDFPRIPLPKDGDIFCELVELGRQLVALHLLDEKQAEILTKPETRFIGKGEARVEKGYPKYENGKVMINSSCHFEDVTPDVWEFHIGGYQVCEKWLKDRAGKGGKNPHPGRVLSEEDILHYRRITVTLQETIRLMAEIDTVINSHGGWPDAFYQAPPPPPSVEEIIKADESHELEFKSTFQWDVKENKKNTELQKSCLKTIAAFLNTKGGTLVIGVTDDKEFYGLEADLKLTKGTPDMFEQTFRHAMDKCIGAAFSPYCKIRFTTSPNNKQVCVVEVEKSKEPAFLTFQGKEDFLIRRGNATKPLSAAEQHDYIKQHFS